MTHDVYICYAPKDGTAALDIARVLEKSGISAWVWIRDLMPGMEWAEARKKAIDEARLFLLLYSANAPGSPEIWPELERASGAGKPIVIVRLDDVPPNKALEYYGASARWVDAQPLAAHYDDIVRAVEKIVGTQLASLAVERDEDRAEPLSARVPASDLESGQNDMLVNAEPSRSARGTTSADAVSFAASYPSFIRPRTAFLAKVWVFPQDRYDEAKMRAGEKAAFESQGAHVLARRAKVCVRLRIGRCTIEPASAELVWSGEIASLGFRVTPAADVAEGDELTGTATIEAGGLRIGTVVFAVAVGGTGAEGFVQARMVRRGFVSYASADRWLVLGRVQGMEKAGVDTFMDVHGLRSNDRYEEKLIQEIDRADRLYLFWSRHARNSAYVEREWRHALAQKGIDFIDPVPLSDPRRAPPPPELASEKHFNDWVLYYERYERSRSFRDRLVELFVRP